MLQPQLGQRQGRNQGRDGKKARQPLACRIGLTGFAVILGFLSVSSIGLIQNKYVNDVDAARSLYRKECGQTAQAVADRFRSVFIQIRQGLRTIAQLHGFRDIEDGSVRANADTTLTAREVCSNLGDNVGLSSLVLATLDSKGRPVVRESIPASGVRSGTVKISEEEFAQIQANLSWFRFNAPFQAQTLGSSCPLITGPEVKTAHIAQGSPAFPSEINRKGLVFSVPLYNSVGKLRGSVSGILLSSRLTELLPNSNFGLVNSGIRFARSIDARGQFEEQHSLSYKGRPNLNAVFSASLPMELTDMSDPWNLWVGFPNQAFYHRKEYLAARQFRDAAVLAVAGFAFISFSFIGYVQRSRTALELANTDLEKQVRERTATLLAARKMEAIGQLAAGIAHEVNTPSQFIGDNLRFLETAFEHYESCLSKIDDLADASSDAQTAGSIQAAVSSSAMSRLRQEVPLAVEESLQGIGRITEIVRAMRDFAHPGQADMAPANINDIVERSVSVARNEWKYVAKVDFRLDPTPPPFVCNAGEIGQIVVILVVNAAQAVKELSSETRLGTITITTRHDDAFLQLLVSDSGVGIPEDIQDRIFEQFFTTKEVGVGTGMGLAIAKNLVDRHGGSIEVASTEGTGTSFTVTFPLQAVRQAFAEDAA